jgi:5-methylcytosine-specific restriction endonuclease McrA
MREKVSSKTASARTLKKYLLITHGEKCWKCGITDWNNIPIVFELEHIDGNSSNNSLENLSILCPNCHSQTPTYKNRNKGNGRHNRRIRYQEGKSF